MSYLAKNSAVQGLQLSVQEIVCQLGDNQVVSTSGSTATINVGENISAVRQALFCDDSAGTNAPVVASNRSVSGSQVVLTLSAALAAADSIRLSYVVAE